MAAGKRAVGRMGLSGNLPVYPSKRTTTSTLKSAKSGKVVSTKVTPTKRRSKSA